MINSFLGLHRERAPGVLPGVGETPILTHIRIVSGHSLSHVDIKRMFTPYAAEMLNKTHGVALHLTDMESIGEMQTGTVPRSTRSNFGGLPHNVTYLMLGRDEPDIIRNSVCDLSGQAEVIPDEFREGDMTGQLPSWIAAHQSDPFPYPKCGSWPRGREHSFHVPLEGLPEF